MSHLTRRARIHRFLRGSDERFGADSDARTARYINYLRNEGRTEHFDPAQYLANYADLNAAFGSNTELATTHFIEHGYFEGRTDQPL